MPVDRTRIALLSICLASIVGMVLPALLHRPPLRAPEAQPWVPLPRSGMDAADPAVRETLVRMRAGSDAANLRGTLAGSCGLDDSTASERYELTIGDWVLRPDARAWHITLVPDGAQVLATVVDTDRYTPPPPLPPGHLPRQHRVALPTVVWLPRDRLEDLRLAWRRLPLWEAPARADRCLDGRPLVLEACVQGRYAARVGGCAGSSGDALWAAAQAALPAPRAAFWVED